MLYALLITFSLLQPAAAQTRQTTAAATPDHIILSWTGDPATSMTVTWRTDTTVESGIIEYGQGPILPDSSQKAEARMHDFTSDMGDSHIFSATLSNLSPDTEYTYRVGNGEKWSAMYSFRTAASEIPEFKFLVFGDSQSPVTGSDPYGLWRDTLHAAFKANPDAAFFINVGDLVDYGQSEAHWNAWFEASKGIIESIPSMPVSGNHESYGMRRIQKPVFFIKQFSLPQNGPDSLKNQAYSFNYGPVHLVALDSQEIEQKSSGDILAIQKPWLEKDLSTNSSAWKIAYFHRSPYGVKKGRDEAEVRDAFCPILEKYGVNIAFTAHDHGVKRTYPIKDGIPVKDPSEGTVYYITGRSGAKTYSDIEPMKYSAFFYAPMEQPNYLVVEGTNRKLTVKAVLQDGTVIDTYTIEKP